MKYFVISNGVIENVIECAPDFDPGGGKSLLSADGVEGGTGWSVVDGVPVAPVVDPTPVYANAVSAHDAFVNWLSDQATAITGNVPLDEKISWLKKEDAARAFKSGAADAAQTAMIQGEAALTGEDTTALADKIIAKADAYRGFATLIVGYRRKNEAEVAAIVDPFDYETTVSANKAAFLVAIGQ